MKCIKCGKEAGRSKFCRDCRDIKQNAVSIVCQNKCKLEKLLKKDYLSPQGFERFIRYTDNIKKYWMIVMEYKKVDTIRKFSNVLTWWIILSCLFSLVFISEIVITLL